MTAHTSSIDIDFQHLSVWYVLNHCCPFILKFNYLQDFSRGAYQVRALAGMIEKVRIKIPGSHSFQGSPSTKVGLIHRGNEEQIPL